MGDLEGTVDGFGWAIRGLALISEQEPGETLKILIMVPELSSVPNQPRAF